MGRRSIFGEAMSAAERQRRYRENLKRTKRGQPNRQPTPSGSLSAAERVKLAKILGMLGSAHAGERSAAGEAATKLLKGPLSPGPMFLM
jgi:hypothetical protein